MSIYGKPRVVANCHIKCITSLPIITGTHPNRVHEFYEDLIVSSQAVDTINNLKHINGQVKITLDKFPGILADLVRLDDDWQDWEFTQPQKMNTNLASVSIAIRNNVNLLNVRQLPKYQTAGKYYRKRDCALAFPILNIGLPNVEVQRHV